MDVEAIKQRQAFIWAQGDYSVLSRQLAPAAQVLCDACAVSAGQEVLDVGAGDGNLAFACAREGASVVACDISTGMVERGRARSEAEGYAVEWVEADAEALPFEDARFDCVGSVFGAFLAPRPEVVSRELFRVVRPGGTVGLTVWTPDGVMAEMFGIGRRFAPPDPDLIPSERWGDEATARERLEPLASHVEVERHRLVFAGDSPRAFLEEFGAAAPTMAAARQTLSPERFEELRSQMGELMERHNAADDGSLRVEAQYAVIVARRRG
ncbi:MAG: class I SAM-dependent methyltransferase [Thermoleophilaceae bacterium]